MARSCRATTSSWTATVKTTQCDLSACKQSAPQWRRKRRARIADTISCIERKNRPGFAYIVVRKAYESSAHDPALDGADFGAYHGGRVFRRPQWHDHGADDRPRSQYCRVFFL